MEKQAKLVNFGLTIARSDDDSREGFEAARDRAGQMMNWVDEAPVANEQDRDLAREAVRKVSRGEPLTPPEENVYEAIVLPTGRPVLNIVNGTYPAPRTPWRHLDQPRYRTVIEKAIAAVGRVEVPDHPSIPYAGTGFVVGDGLLMTNRHVAEIFVLGLGIRELRFRSGLESAGVDFRREVDSKASEYFEIRQVLMLHPYWDMALFQVDGLRNRTPLTLQAEPAQDLENQEVVVIGYPAEDPRNDHDLQQRIFGGRFQVKRLQPGKLMGTRQTNSFGHPVQAMAHNSSTLGGNSGSAVISVKTGMALGLHFGGVYLEANYAVSGYELSRDPFVYDKGVKFTSRHSGVLPWQSFWDKLSQESERQPAARRAPSSFRRRSRVRFRSMYHWLLRSASELLPLASRTFPPLPQARRRSRALPHWPTKRVTWRGRRRRFPTTMRQPTKRPVTRTTRAQT